MLNDEGAWIWIEEMGSGVDYDVETQQPLRACGTCRDISNRLSLQHDDHGGYDALTALPNQKLLMERLSQSLALCLRHQHKGALLSISLDHFSSIEETFGYGSATKLLKEVARRLVQEIRKGDTPAHKNGEQFLLLFHELSDDIHHAAQQAKLGADNIYKALSEPYLIGGDELHITLSIGIAVFPHGNDDTPEKILLHADTALSRALKEGRESIRFYLTSMQMQAEDQIRLKRDLRKALMGNQLHLDYQPQVDGGGHIIGAEALVRWHHPFRGVILPKDFTSIAEESGLMLEISDWILKQALRQFYQWQQAGFQEFQRISVNISPVQFHNPDFVQSFQQILTETGADPKHLILEITEDTLIENFEEAERTMMALNRLGVRFAIDDFGTGYSSITYLRRLPLDELKIDHSFIKDIETYPKEARMVSTIVAMANQMALEVVAEGIETEGQFALLKDQGCNLFQGYLFSRPIAPDVFEELLRHPVESVCRNP
jgi:diguanylate cyclase (GGDEF)-like protein